MYACHHHHSPTPQLRPKRHYAPGVHFLAPPSLGARLRRCFPEPEREWLVLALLTEPLRLDDAEDDDMVGLSGMKGYLLPPPPLPLPLPKLSPALLAWLFSLLLKTLLRLTSLRLRSDRSLTEVRGRTPGGLVLLRGSRLLLLPTLELRSPLTRRGIEDIGMPVLSRLRGL